VTRVPEVVLKAENFINLLLGKATLNVRIVRNGSAEIFALPTLRRVSLGNLVGVFASHSGLNERDHHVLREHKITHQTKVLVHSLWEDLEAREDARQAIEHEIGQLARVRENDALE
jgi:hypothetical protein